MLCRYYWIDFGVEKNDKKWKMKVIWSFSLKSSCRAATLTKTIITNTAANTMIQEETWKSRKNVTLIKMNTSIIDQRENAYYHNALLLHLSFSPSLIIWRLLDLRNRLHHLSVRSREHSCCTSHLCAVFTWTWEHSCSGDSECSVGVGHTDSVVLWEAEVLLWECYSGSRSTSGWTGNNPLFSRVWLSDINNRFMQLCEGSGDIARNMLLKGNQFLAHLNTLMQKFLP